MGILIGPFVLDLVGKQEYLDFLGYTGFLFLIFLSGLETDVVKIAY
jgi:Kef-type K+ transport system membrane component KefB